MLLRPPTQLLLLLNSLLRTRPAIRYSTIRIRIQLFAHPHHAHAHNPTMTSASRIPFPALFICDMQEAFRTPIPNFSHMVSTCQKLLSASQILPDLPVFVSTQNRSRLGNTVSELDVRHAVADVDKTTFSMMKVAEIRTRLPAAYSAVAIVGIEAHICVTQTALDLLKEGHRVYVLADGVASCNPQEVPVALARLRAEGVVVTTSESWLFELLGDASTKE